MIRRITLLSMTALICIVAVGYGSRSDLQQRPLLREVYTPSFAPVPPQTSIGHALAQLRTDLASSFRGGRLWRLPPDQAGNLWIALLVLLVIAVDFL
jgi:hypothetical protein